ncbi:hypothetical protein T12_2929 [Trichinella patagoniensis]|uniref:Uncharacterized protein n=1 Tax=Trichinella patagoniensis TaxID=990121 RepID=A0A0V0ZRL4_9BILA|nr:hypothetical protein T12_2929 [Trichinella patagoniensis]
MDYIINIELVHTPALMALPSIGPEICVASFITESTCAGFRIPHTSLVVRVAISAFGEYFRRIRNHVDKYAITKHYYQLMPLSLATYVHFTFINLNVNQSKKTRKLWNMRSIVKGESGKNRREARGITLRLRPRANKNLHMPLGYPPGNL